MGLFSFFSSAPTTKRDIYFHNTLSDTKERFTPRSSTVSMYNCGPTVYSRQHIGNLRPYVFADTIRRTLLLQGYKVTQVINITDVGHIVADADQGEDKMEMAAKQEGRTAQEIAAEITALWMDDLQALGISTRSIQFPRATEYIEEQIALVKTLLQKGYAYQTSDGIYFDTSKFAAYGKLGHLDLAGLQEGARVEANKEKRTPFDFALWKFSPKDEQREQEWESPWGTGFPGWHIECTAMIFKLLGKQIDIHTGGIDHIPVHHNNEIAQAEAATGKQYVQYWMHNEHISIEGKKISKSLGNTIYLSQLVDRGLSARSLRYLYLTVHYRSPMNFTWDAITGADTALKRLLKIYIDAPTGSIDTTFMDAFYTELCDDLNTPKALALVWEHSKTLSKATLTEVDKALGLGLSEAKPVQRLTVTDGSLPADIQALMEKREEARTQKDFTLADSLRDELASLGYTVTDSASGQSVTKND